MPGPRQSHDYRKIVKGECGHDCDEFPQASVKGGRLKVVCDVCEDWVHVAGKPKQLTIQDALSDEPGY